MILQSAYAMAVPGEREASGSRPFGSLSGSETSGPESPLEVPDSRGPRRPAAPGFRDLLRFGMKGELPPEHHPGPPFQRSPAHHAHHRRGGGVPLLHQVFVHLGLAGG